MGIVLDGSLGGGDLAYDKDGCKGAHTNLGAGDRHGDRPAKQRALVFITTPSSEMAIVEPK